MIRKILFTGFLLALTGCATTQPPRKIEIKKEQISLQDNRSQEDKARKKKALYSPIVFLAEDRLSPRAIDIFQADLVDTDSFPKPIKLEIDQFRIIDYYPARLATGAPVGGFLGSLLISSMIENNTDWNFVKEVELPRDKDFLLCVVIGKLNGKPIKVVTKEPYTVSAFAMLIYDDPGYQSALNLVIKRAAEEAIKQSQTL